MTPTLLIELLTEELPPNSLKKLGESFTNTIFNELVKAQFVQPDSVVTTYASPRRLAVQIKDVLAKQAEQQVIRKGPSLSAALLDGKPTPALLGFARSCKVELDQLSIINEAYAYQFTKSGMSLNEILSGIVDLALNKLPVAKLMRWGDSSYQFVRPAHGLVMLHGEMVITGTVLGLTSSRSTLGHRFMSEGLIDITDADSYQTIMAEQGKVIASFSERLDKIKSDLTAKAEEIGCTIIANESLYEEVCALVEFPVVLAASFDEKFLAVPRECLILTMQKNQKYFPLMDKQGELSNQFLLVSNLESADPTPIINGNQRVLRARLSDAQFFFEQDKKQTLESRVEALKNVVYHNKLGSQFERVERLIEIAGYIANIINPAIIDDIKRAAKLCKADLLSEMVGEFPELQGTIGRYYALNDGENLAVANAIAEHYLPRFSGDKLPENEVSIVLALADKLETLVGIWGIGLIPTGDKDPFGLRRAALGIMCILLKSERNLDLFCLLLKAKDVLVRNTFDVSDIYGFCIERLKNYLLNKYALDIIDTVLFNQYDQKEMEKRSPTISSNTEYLINFNEIEAKLAGVMKFQTLSQAASLIAGHKRVKNILRKNKTFTTDAKLDEKLLSEPAECDLYKAMNNLNPKIERETKENNYSAALCLLSELKTPIDNFFDNVMVMDDSNKDLRNNRLVLLYKLNLMLTRVADISMLNI